jgi:hypothetical protein
VIKTYYEKGRGCVGGIRLEMGETSGAGVEGRFASLSFLTQGETEAGRHLWIWKL